jgi:hypothetical protein
VRARDIGLLVGRLRELFAVAAHGDGIVHLQPVPTKQHRQLEAELRLASAALFDPASLLSTDERVNAVLADEDALLGVLEQLTDEALIGELARRGKWVLEHERPHVAVVLDQVLEVRSGQDETALPDLHPAVSAAACRAELGLQSASTLADYVVALGLHGELYWLALLVSQVAQAGEADSDAARRTALLHCAARAVHWIEDLDRRAR